VRGWNGVAAATLLRKEVRRFTKVWLQTVLSPLVTTSLYFLVFGVALGSRLRTVDGVPYVNYVVPGLVMLAMISNSFLNSSSSLFQSKVNGTYVDLLVAPLGAQEMLYAYAVAALIRGHLVAVMVWAVAVTFIGFELSHPAWTLFFSVAVCLTFGALGLVVAIWAEKFDQLAVVPNFVLTPLTFLGGVFYSVDMLPSPWNAVSAANPMLYMVNGLRFGIIGISDVPVLRCAAVVLPCAVAANLAAWALLRSGTKFRT
jgi:ABC-2 type transport system permease protein